MNHHLQGTKLTIDLEYYSEDITIFELKRMREVLLFFKHDSEYTFEEEDQMNLDAIETVLYYMGAEVE